MNWRYCEYLYK